jgi:hypothetical protein
MKLYSFYGFQTAICVLIFDKSISLGLFYNQLKLNSCGENDFYVIEISENIL